MTINEFAYAPLFNCFVYQLSSSNYFLFIFDSFQQASFQLFIIYHNSTMLCCFLGTYTIISNLVCTCGAHFYQLLSERRRTVSQWLFSIFVSVVCITYDLWCMKNNGNNNNSKAHFPVLIKTIRTYKIVGTL